MTRNTTISRRSFLASAAATCWAAGRTIAQELPSAGRSESICLRCGGIGRVPLKDAKPFVWVEGMPPAKGESAVGEQGCPACQPETDPARLAAEAEDRIDAALAKHAQWEERTGWKLICVITRHASIHTQLTAAQARSVGTALENLTLHLKRVTGSLVLTPTRCDTYEQMILWEKPAWEQFRKVMEGLYTPEQLGEAWGSARAFNSYDHFVTPHLFETSQSIRNRPPACGSVFLAARRQINVATAWHAPLWLAEGFAAYGDHAVHKVNRWFTVYDVEQARPIGDFMSEARRLAAEAKLRSWSQLFKRELRDWTPADYCQSMAITAFLLETEPAKFLELTRRLKSGELDVAAVEDAYAAKLDELEQRGARWLIGRR